MKKPFALFVILLLAPLASFAASHSQPSPSSQLRFKPKHLSAKTDSKTPQHRQGDPSHHPMQAARPGISSRPASSVKPRKNTSNTTTPTPVAFVAATQVPTSGADDNETYPVMGDFAGSGNQSVAKVVVTGGESPVYSISAILSNGDGTFQAAKLTATANDSDDPIVVGDVNGDGKDDILMVHPNGQNGCDDVAAHKANDSCPVSSFDVYLSNGDGTFTLGNNYLISPNGLNGGVLTTLSNGNLGILAIDNENPALVVSVQGNGDGTFAAPTTFATLSGPAPNGIFFADFNGDGNLDFAGQSEGQLQVYLATDSGFAPPVALVTSDGNYNSCFNTAGDLTGDGKPEIVSVNCEINTITVYLNNGDGSFQPGFYYNNAGDQYTDPYGATIADVNGDGKNDVIVDDEYSGLLTIFLNVGDGSLINPTIGYDTGGFPWTPPLIADFNGDGLADIMVADDYYSFAFLPGYGDGTFRAAPTYFLPHSFSMGAYSYSVATGDFNGDGFPDVVSGQDSDFETSNPGVVVYLANPDGSLQPGVYYGNSSTLAYVTVGDFNGDGKLDIAATDFENGVVQIFLGNGDGTFTTGLSYATDSIDAPPYPFNLITGDFNKDGKLDLAIANSGSDSVGVLFGNGDGTFGGLANYYLSASAYGIASADLNGDGYLDLAVTINSGTANTVAVLLNTSDSPGTFGPETDIATGTGIPEYVALGDLNGDGKADMLVSLNDGAMIPSALVVALGNGDGTFQAPVPYSATAQDGGLGDSYVANVQLLDFNGDGNLDAVYVNEEYGTVGLMLGNGDGTFGAPVEFPTTAYVWGMALADINNDGAVDVVTGNDESGGVSVLLNSGGTGTAPNYTLGTQTPIVAVTPGSTATYNLTITGSNLYNGTVTLACTSGLPSEATCTFTPASVVTQGNLPQATVLTITTTAPSTTTAFNRPVRINPRPGSPTLLASFAGLGLFGLVLASGGKQNKRIRMTILLGVALLALMFTMFGCDNDNNKVTTTGNPGTPAGSYTVVVTATGSGTNAPTHTLNVTLVVE